MAEMVGSKPAPSPVSSRTIRYLLLLVGSLSVATGVIGIFVPLLPTTIFLLIGAACYGRSSPGAYTWLTTNRYFGKYLRDYHEERGATLFNKVTSIAALWLGIGAAMYFLGLPIWANLILLAIAAGVTFHLLRLRTLH